MVELKDAFEDALKDEPEGVGLKKGPRDYQNPPGVQDIELEQLDHFGVSPDNKLYCKRCVGGTFPGCA